jgi:DNA-binding NarL/FixJ family response regulator
MIKILIADDHAMFRDGIIALLENERGLQPVGSASNGHEAIAQVGRLAPDIALIDVVMPILNGLEATSRIMDEYPDVRVIALGERQDTVTMARVAMSGALGYVLKGCAFSELVRAIFMVAETGRYVCPGIAVDLADPRIRRLRASDRNLGEQLLTPREREVVQLLAEGRTTRKAAELLQISVKTAETHRANIFRKLGFRSIAELTKFAIREGLTEI